MPVPVAPMSPPYIGRFAPSPTGPLHFGSLIAAVASYLDARACGGQWLVRMEDIDPPREMPGAADLILRQLEDHGLFWEDEVVYQSQRSAYYDHIIERLLADDLAYACECSRQQVQAMGGIYNGRCARRRLPLRGNALRLRVPPDTLVVFDDLFQGLQRQCLSREVGDFVIHRRDGLYAYQLAVVADDADQGVSHVIRGSDLLDSTTRQLHLFNVLGLQTPVYGHVPVAANGDGQKLSKQNLARSLSQHQPGENLVRALVWLGFDQGSIPESAGVETILGWAAQGWRRSLVPRRLSMQAPEGY